MIVILNFGSQFTHLIARRLRELHVDATIRLPHQVTDQELEMADAIILSGGPNSVAHERIPYNNTIFACAKPLLGICYGYQLIAQQFGGIISPSHSREYGAAQLTVINKSDLFDGLDDTETVWMSHGDTITTLPHEFEIIGTSANQHAAAIAHHTKHIYGIQFHPEVHHTKHGKRILQNFIHTCGIAQTEKQAHNPSTIIASIKKTVGDASVIMGVSGGVDSLVASYALYQAIGDHLFCVYIDTGLMRLHETEYVKKMYEDLGFAHFNIIEASETFLNNLAGISDPEEKRKIIGHTFIRLFEHTVKQMKQQYGTIAFLGQGTIYPDTIESAASSQTAHKIKSHHNVTLPENMNLKLVEPLRDLYKDEVRELGKRMGIANAYLQRHPFPGPGLAVRILGAIDKDNIRMVRHADHIFMQALKKFNLYNDVWQAFAALIPIKTVGVMGDTRTYEYIISLRAVTSVDGMTADWAQLAPNLLHYVSNKIINEVNGVNRVLYDITQKPPGTIEYE